MKLHIDKGKAARVALGFLLAGCAGVVADSGTIDFPNHHLHNFGASSRAEGMIAHAQAMGYRLLVAPGPRDTRIGGLPAIALTNASICPIRVHKQKSTGKTFVSYHRHFDDAEGKSAIARLHGLDRNAGELYPLSEADLDLIKGYGAATKPIDDLTVENATYEEICSRFNTKWPTEDREYLGRNLSMNWINRTVVANCIEARTKHFPWDKYDAMFFDSLGGGATKLDVTNADFLPGGTYATRAEGHLAFVKAVCNFARDTAKTGVARPYLLFTNIYAPKAAGNCAREWYAKNLVRFDHYYYEKGGLGTQGANGVVPGTTEPAYLDETGVEGPDIYLPARLVALDDVYEWSRLPKYLDAFDHAAFFKQHLDAAITAAMQGSWFGWYGEDFVEQKAADGRLIYSNANLLLRAIPNWDNMIGIPVPAYAHYTPEDLRQFDADAYVYASPNSLISRKVIWSRHPDTGELFTVFVEADGLVRLRDTERPTSAVFANEWFGATAEDAMGTLDFDAHAREVRLRDSARVGQGIRIGLTSK